MSGMLRPCIPRTGGLPMIEEIGIVVVVSIYATAWFYSMMEAFDL